MIYCSDSLIYTGITTDIRRRWQEHHQGTAGAKFFRGRRPEAVIFLEPSENRSVASKREHQIKKLSRKAKISLSQETHQQTLSLLEMHSPEMVERYHIRSSGIS